MNYYTSHHQTAFRIIPLLLVITVLVLPVSAAPTTTLSIELIENNTTTFEKTVDYTWLEENLPVFGDGVVHYYHQGPVFQGDPWDPNETVNLRDMGAIKGTRIVDLANLTGPLQPDDEVMIKSADGYHVQFTSDTLTNPHPLLGDPVIAWYNGAEAGAGERQGAGYVPDYYTGMRLVIGAPENPATGKHVFGNTDMNVSLPEKAQYFYSGLYPSTGGLSAKWVDGIRVYRGGYTGDASAPLKAAPEPTKTQASSFPFLSLLIAGCIGLIFFKEGLK